MLKDSLEKQASVYPTQPMPRFSVHLRSSEGAGPHPWNVPTPQMGKRALEVQQQEPLAPARRLPPPLDSSRVLVTSQTRRGVSTALLPWFYRCWLLGTTVILSLALLPAFLYGTLPHTACICADGHREEHCRALAGKRCDKSSAVSAPCSCCRAR